MYEDPCSSSADLRHMQAASCCFAVPLVVTRDFPTTTPTSSSTEWHSWQPLYKFTRNNMILQEKDMHVVATEAVMWDYLLTHLWIPDTNRN